MATIRQAAFTGGELDPLLWGRPDVAVYSSALRTCNNWLPLRTGPLRARQGMRVCGVVDPDAYPQNIQLQAFTFSDGRTYVFEFGLYQIRLYYQGGLVLDGTDPYVFQKLDESEDPIQLFKVGAGNVLNFAQSGDDIVIVNYEPGTDYYALPMLLSYASPEAPGDPPTLTLVNYPFTSTLAEPTTPTFTGTPATTDSSADHPPKQWSWWITSLHPTGQSLPSAELKTGSGLVVLYPDRTPVAFSWTAATGAIGYLIYRGQYGRVGLVGYTTKTTYSEDGSIAPDMGIPPPRSGYWESSEQCTSVAYFQQRLAFGVLPQRVRTSEVGDFHNFDYVNATFPDAPKNFTVASVRADLVRHLVPLGRGLVVLTNRSETIIAPADNGGFDPPNIQTVSQNGCNAFVPPQIANNKVLYCTDTYRVRDLAFSNESGGFAGNDISLIARHLFQDNYIVDMAWQDEESILWVVRDDGLLCSCTYQPEGQITAWATHETAGIVRQVCVSHEDGHDYLYLVVDRTNLLGTTTTVERMLPELWVDPWDAVHLDCAVTFDGRNTNDDSAVVIFAYYDKGTYGEADIPDLAMADIGDYLVLGYGTENEARLLITGITEGGRAIFYNEVDMPTPYKGGTFYDWAWARKLFIATFNPWGALAGVSGRGFCAMGDGNLVAYPSVVSGEFTLPVHCVVVHAGLCYTSTAETLDIAEATSDIRARQKLISKISVEVKDTPYLAAQAGDFPEDEIPQPILPVDQDSRQTALEPIAGIFELRGAGSWTQTGRAKIVQNKPFPATLLAIYREVQTGGAR